MADDPTPVSPAPPESEVNQIPEPSGTQDETLWGSGYVRLNRRRKQLLSAALTIGLVAIVGGLLVFAGWVLMTSEVEEATVFVKPPPVKTYQPRKLEHRVKVRKKQRSSSRPSMMPRMVAMKKSSLVLPEIKLNPKVIKSSFQPKFKAVSGAGMGVGLGSGYGLGGFGGGVAQFNFFGIRGRGDKIAVLVDVSVSMVEEQRGGPAGFMAVKNRINQVIDGLHQESMFSVVAFADACQVWKRQLQVATEENKREAKRFVRPFNTENNWGLTSGNYSGVISSETPAVGGTTRLDLALTAAFEMEADTILIISDGLPQVVKGMTPAEQQAFNQRLQAWHQANAGRMQAWQQQQQEMAANAQYEERKVWIPPQPAIPAPKGPPKEGQRQRGPRPAQPGRWVTKRVRIDKQPGGGAARPRPPSPPKRMWTYADFVRHLQVLYAKRYESKGKKQPVIHCIGYGIESAGGKFLQDLAREYKGKYRRVARM